MQSPTPEATSALRAIADQLDADVRASGYSGAPIKMIVAGGLAVHRYCDTRHTGDVDATFTARLMPRGKPIIGEYRGRDGSPRTLYLDKNFNPAFALLHSNFDEDAREWPGLENSGRLVQVFVLSPVDLATSKLSRYSEQDREDILALASVTDLTPEALKARAEDAMIDYIGDKSSLRQNLEDAMRQMIRFRGVSTPRQGPKWNR